MCQESRAAAELLLLLLLRGERRRRGGPRRRARLCGLFRDPHKEEAPSVSLDLPPARVDRPGRVPHLHSPVRQPAEVALLDAPSRGPRGQGGAERRRRRRGRLETRRDGVKGDPPRARRGRLGQQRLPGQPREVALRLEPARRAAVGARLVPRLELADKGRQALEAGRGRGGRRGKGAAGRGEVGGARRRALPRQNVAAGRASGGPPADAWRRGAARRPAAQSPNERSS
ncbi:hypothetical protein EMIHUDRAFT_432324 [Emiliania huxleyi CCMP1516]|uniref:Uncharacterized protein n=2 Tax=Emiliania huxleyi TaxID=2903 RepID=A0A0D3J3X5_EMIH1|nr:hypothetical protein EMIHUDRAFT_432324 [Emiliania huxleyi CCMP1516]EOD18210.1 hypothetical protein EMIHUDRAFT_432324 [Emiliania huxleyi CCMP1516]|eukprot:XP_005770639.1 hypothetical protein EMIHUDRAFT_432324 [Emiliania huxleyi CCMP1516]